MSFIFESEEVEHQFLNNVANSIENFISNKIKKDEELKEAVCDFYDKHAPQICDAKKQAMEMIKSSKEKIEDSYKKFNENLKAQKLAHAKNCEIDVYEI